MAGAGNGRIAWKQIPVPNVQDVFGIAHNSCVQYARTPACTRTKKLTSRSCDERGQQRTSVRVVNPYA